MEQDSGANHVFQSGDKQTYPKNKGMWKGHVQAAGFEAGDRQKKGEESWDHRKISTKSFELSPDPKEAAEVGDKTHFLFWFFKKSQAFMLSVIIFDQSFPSSPGSAGTGGWPEGQTLPEGLEGGSRELQT